jgi:hypothetical protein
MAGFSFYPDSADISKRSGFEFFVKQMGSQMTVQKAVVPLDGFLL